MEGCIEDIGLLELVQLHLGIPHLVLHTLELGVQLQLLPFKFTIFPLVPGSHQGSRKEGLWRQLLSPHSSEGVTLVI